MADDVKADVKPEPQPHPKCPHCGSEPMTLSCKELAFPNGIVLLMVWCANKDCLKVLTASYLRHQTPRIVTPILH